VDSSLSRAAEGTGIGLSLVKKLVDYSGGSINVKSEVGKGSTFTVELPSGQVDEEICVFRDVADKRLIHETAIEFSDIYI
jgi:signal transduction histidine kinase